MVQTQNRPGCIGIFMGWLRGIIGRETSETLSLPYRLRDDFLSPAELSFYKVLCSSVESTATVCPKVRLADVLFVTRPNENFSFVNRMAQRHVDFLLCDPNSMIPIMVVELDDSSHKRDSQKTRDEFLDEALAVAELPILRVTAQSGYSEQDLKSQLAPLIERSPIATESSVAEAEISGRDSHARASEQILPLCPKCGEPMVMRVASKGKSVGQTFYGCVNFPQCREILPFETRLPTD